MHWITTYNSVRPIKKAPWPFSASSVFKCFHTRVVLLLPGFALDLVLLIGLWMNSFLEMIQCFIFVAILWLETRSFGYMFFSFYCFIISSIDVSDIIGVLFNPTMHLHRLYVCKNNYWAPNYAKHYSEHLACVLSFSLNIQGLFLLSPFYSWGNKRKGGKVIYLTEYWESQSVPVNLEKSDYGAWYRSDGIYLKMVHTCLQLL